MAKVLNLATLSPLHARVPTTVDRGSALRPTWRERAVWLLNMRTLSRVNMELPTATITYSADGWMMKR